jgi:stage II sporulation protein D
LKRNSVVIILFFLIRCTLAAYSEDMNSNLVRVAILRDVSSLPQAIKALCQHEYPGTVQVSKDSSGNFMAVNILNVEDYLLGAVSCEMNPKGPLEALKAQAIAARSHALYLSSTSQTQPYDLVANLSQAYQGKTKLQKNVVLAIESTRGQVLYSHKKLIPAYYHESCGGHTTSATQVWPSTDSKQTTMFALLPGSTSCPYCAKSQTNKWSFETSRATFNLVLGQNGYKIGAVPIVKIVDKDDGGHVKNVSIESELKPVLLNAEVLRSILGYSNLKSTLFTVSQPANPDGTPGDLIAFRGAGYGHGVGLCQYGAQEMAAKGSSYKDILARYYPGCSVGPIEPNSIATATQSYSLQEIKLR